MLKNLLLLSGFSTFVVIIIVGLDVYHNLTISSLKPSTQKKIIPIAPSFDVTTLNRLKLRDSITIDLSQRSTVTSEDSKETTPTVSELPQDTIQQASNEAALAIPAQ